jgi:hypothetical protein
MSDSDDDPWPGACCGRTGFVTRSYYQYRHTIADTFCTFFNINHTSRYTMYQIEGFILDYIHTHHGYTNKIVNVDEALWKIMGLLPDQPFRERHIEQYVRPFLQGERPCPVCTLPRTFEARVPNGLCQACTTSPDLLDSKGQPATVSKRKWTTLSPGFFTRIEELIETDYTLHGIHCKRCDFNDDILLEAVVLCPICMTEVKEERRLGAFCDRCARSESLVDANGNRVRFKPPKYDEIGFRVVSYENGEITERLHVGDFPCFFQDVPCVAEDKGTKARVIVRFLNPLTRSWPTMAPPIKGSFYTDGKADIKDEDDWIAATSSDWLDPSYPRWAMYK